MQFLEKILKNVRKHKNYITTEARRNYLVSEPNYHTTLFLDNLLAIEMKTTQILKNKPAYQGLSILGNSKIVIYEF